MYTIVLHTLTLYEIFAYFFLYSFLGWVSEVAFHAVKTGKFVNRGFLNGPVCPIYGAGVVLILLILGEYAQTMWAVFLVGVTVPTLLELVTGWLLETFFHDKWWDYSERRFNFKGGDQQKLVGALSGGERGRLHLAKTLLAGGNVLLLDEPSNDLDVETLRALEEALLEFAGCALVTSHDRWFLDRIATHILAFEGDSKVVFFDGNYNEYEADKRRRLGEAACQPKRLRFKPLKH